MAGFYDGLNPALGAFMLGFQTTRQIMQERAQRLEWQEFAPKIQGQFQELFAPVEQAGEEAQNATDPKARQAAQAKMLQALAGASRKGMDLAARLAASGNPYAAKYAEGLQASIVQASQSSMAQAKFEMDVQAQSWQREFDQRKLDQGLQIQQLENEQQNAAREDTQAFQAEQGQLDRLAHAQESAVDNARADKALQLDRERLEFDKQRLSKAPPTDPVEKYKLAIALDSQYREGGSKNLRDQGFKELGLEAGADGKEVDVTQLDKTLAARVDKLRTIAETSPDPKVKQMAQEDLDEAMQQVAALQRAYVETERERRKDPRGWFKKFLDSSGIGGSLSGDRFEPPPGAEGALRGQVRGMLEQPSSGAIGGTRR